MGTSGAGAAPRLERANGRARGRARGGGDVGSVALGARAACALLEEASVGGEEDAEGRGQGVPVRVAGGDSRGHLPALGIYVPAVSFRTGPCITRRASMAASMKGAMKHGFLQLAVLTSLYCRNLSTH